MAIVALYAPKNIQVVVVDVMTYGNRKRALIRAIAGEPFTVQTHGGPMTTASALVSPDLLTGIHQVQTWTQAERANVAGLFPSRYDRNRAASTARGGINND